MPNGANIDIDQEKIANMVAEQILGGIENGVSNVNSILAKKKYKMSIDELIELKSKTNDGKTAKVIDEYIKSIQDQAKKSIKKNKTDLANDLFLSFNEAKSAIKKGDINNKAIKDFVSNYITAVSKELKNGFGTSKDRIDMGVLYNNILSFSDTAGMTRNFAENLVSEITSQLNIAENEVNKRIKNFGKTKSSRFLFEGKIGNNNIASYYRDEKVIIENLNRAATQGAKQSTLAWGAALEVIKGDLSSVSEDVINVLNDFKASDNNKVFERVTSGLTELRTKINEGYDASSVIGDLDKVEVKIKKIKESSKKEKGLEDLINTEVFTKRISEVENKIKKVVNSVNTSGQYMLGTTTEEKEFLSLVDELDQYYKILGKDIDEATQKAKNGFLNEGTLPFSSNNEKNSNNIIKALIKQASEADNATKSMEGLYKAEEDLDSTTLPLVEGQQNLQEEYKKTEKQAEHTVKYLKKIWSEKQLRQEILKYGTDDIEDENEYYEAEKMAWLDDGYIREYGNGYQFRDDSWIDEHNRKIIESAKKATEAEKELADAEINASQSISSSSDVTVPLIEEQEALHGEVEKTTDSYEKLLNLLYEIKNVGRSSYEGKYNSDWFGIFDSQEEAISYDLNQRKTDLHSLLNIILSEDKNSLESLQLEASNLKKILEPIQNMVSRISSNSSIEELNKNKGSEEWYKGYAEEYKRIDDRLGELQSQYELTNEELEEYITLQVKAEKIMKAQVDRTGGVKKSGAKNISELHTWIQKQFATDLGLNADDVYNGLFRHITDALYEGLNGISLYDDTGTKKKLREIASEILDYQGTIFSGEFGVNEDTERLSKINTVLNYIKNNLKEINSTDFSSKIEKVSKNINRYKENIDKGESVDFYSKLLEREEKELQELIVLQDRLNKARGLEVSSSTQNFDNETKLSSDKNGLSSSGTDIDESMQKRIDKIKKEKQLLEELRDVNDLGDYGKENSTSERYYNESLDIVKNTELTYEEIYEIIQKINSLLRESKELQYQTSLLPIDSEEFDKLNKLSGQKREEAEELERSLLPIAEVWEDSELFNEKGNIVSGNTESKTREIILSILEYISTLKLELGEIDDQKFANTISGIESLKESFKQTETVVDSTEKELVKIGSVFRGVRSQQKEFMHGFDRPEAAVWATSEKDLYNTLYTGNNKGKTYSADYYARNPLIIDAKGQNYQAVTYLGDGSDEASKKITALYNRMQELKTIRQELINQGETESQQYIEILKELGLVTKQYENMSNSKSNVYGTHWTDDFIPFAKANGYDALVFKNIYDDTNGLADTFAVWTEEQVKNIELIASGEEELLKVHNELKDSYKSQPNESDISSQGTTDDLIFSYKKLIEYIDKSSMSTSQFFEKLKNNEISLDDELENILKSLDVVNSKFISSGTQNGGGIIGNDYTIISRELDDISGRSYKFNNDLQENLKKASEEGANVGEIITTITSDSGKFYEIQRTMPGIAVGSASGYTNWLKATDEQILKLIEDLSILKKNNLGVDVLGENLLYDENKGFSFIDLANGNDKNSANDINTLINKLLRPMFQDSGIDSNIINRIKELSGHSNDINSYISKDVDNTFKGTSFDSVKEMFDELDNVIELGNIEKDELASLLEEFQSIASGSQRFDYSDIYDFYGNQRLTDVFNNDTGIGSYYKDLLDQYNSKLDSEAFTDIATKLQDYEKEYINQVISKINSILSSNVENSTDVAQEETKEITIENTVSQLEKEFEARKNNISSIKEQIECEKELQSINNNIADSIETQTNAWLSLAQTETQASKPFKNISQSLSDNENLNILNQMADAQLGLLETTNELTDATKKENQANKETANSSEDEENKLQGIEQQAEKTSKAKKKVTKANKDLAKAAVDTSNKVDDEVDSLDELAKTKADEMLDGRNILSQTGLRHVDETGFGQFSFRERTQEGQIQTVIANWNNETQQWEESLNPIVTNFKQLESAIERSDKKLSNLNRELSVNQNKYGEQYDSSALEQRIELERAYNDELTRTLLNYSDEEEYIYEINRFLEERDRRLADVELTNQNKNNIDQVRNSINELTRQKLSTKMSDWLNKNSRASRETKEQVNSLITRLETLDNAGDIKSISTEFEALKQNAIAAGKTGLSFFDKWKSRIQNLSVYLTSFVSFYQIIGIGKNIYKSITDLDTTLIDLKKTTSMTTYELNEFYYSSNNIARQMGVTTKEIIEQASAFSRLGFSSKEASEQMAELSSQFASISPDMDVSTATDGLVSVMKAFEVDVEDVERKILDNINIIGNTAATSNGEIVDMLMRSSAAMKEANNSLEETIALETAAVEITRNAETTGTAFKTVSMRIRGKQTLPPYTVTCMLCA